MNPRVPNCRTKQGLPWSHLASFVFLILWTGCRVTVTLPSNSSKTGNSATSSTSSSSGSSSSSTTTNQSGGNSGGSPPSGGIHILHLPAGTVDPTFRTYGRVHTSLDSSYGDAVTPQATALQSDGKLLIGGFGDDTTVFAEADNFALFRYTSDGTLDSSFGNNGNIITHFGSSQSFLMSLLVQSNGKILALGTLANSYGPTILLARYNSDGTLDTTSFGFASYLSDGTVDSSGTVLPGAITLTSNHQNSRQIWTTLGQQQDKILVGLSVYLGSFQHQLRIYRFNADGSFDKQFDLDSLSQAGNFALKLTSIKTLSSGKILVTGRDASEAFLIRYNSDGTLDSSFGTAGVAIDSALTHFNFGDGIEDSTILPDGTVYAAVNYQWDGKLSVIKYLPDGSRDLSFGTGGMAEASVDVDETTSLGFQTLNGVSKLIIGGTNYYEYVFARFDLQGNPDASFGQSGLVIASPDEDYGPRSLVVQEDGNFIATGYNSFDLSAIRFDKNGAFDNSFGDEKFVTTTFFDQTDPVEAEAHAVLPLSDGSVVAAGYASHTQWSNSLWDGAITKYRSDGSLDTSFGNQGKVIVDVPHTDKAFRFLASLPDGGILAGGYSDSDLALAKLKADGTLDSSFGGTGYVTTTISGPDWWEIIQFRVQQDGKILVLARRQWWNYGGDIVVARYNSNGTLDTTFGSTGTTPGYVSVAASSWLDPSLTNLKIIKMAFDPSDSTKAYAAGYVIDTNTGQNAFALVRYLISGDSVDIDPSFNSSTTPGIAFTEIGNSTDKAYALAVQPLGGKIIVGGSSRNALSQDRFALARYNTDGSLDSSFGTAGTVVTPLGLPNANTSEQINALLVQPDDQKIIAAGISPYNHVAAVVRYLADGTLDSSFGGGIVTQDIAPRDLSYYFNSAHLEPTALALQPGDQKIIVAGFGVPGQYSFKHYFSLFRIWP